MNTTPVDRDDAIPGTIVERDRYSFSVPDGASVAPGRDGAALEVLFDTGARINIYESVTGPDDIDLQSDFADNFACFRSAPDATVLERRKLVLPTVETPCEFGVIRFLDSAGDRVIVFVLTVRTDDSHVVSLVAAAPFTLTDAQGEEVANVLNTVRLAVAADYVDGGR